MTIEQIDENKLKITLSNSELEKHEITAGDLSSTSVKLKKFLISLVRRAARETGFEAAGSSIMVESHLQDDSLTFLITKISSGIAKPRPVAKAIKSPAPKPTAIPVKKSASAFFVFQNERSFAEFFSTVKKEDFSDSALYCMEGRYYFKTLPDGRLYTHALEFANPVYSQLLAIRLSKDARLICRGESFLRFL